MGSTLAPSAPVRHHQSGPSVDVLLGIRLGVLPATAHNYLHDTEDGVFVVAALMAETLTAHGHIALRNKKAVRLLAALTDAPAPRPSAVVLHEAQVADMNEDILESAYRQTPTPQTRQRFLDALYATQALGDELIRALEAEKAGEVA